MSKNIVIGLLLALLTIAGFLITREEHRNLRGKSINEEEQNGIIDEKSVETPESEHFDENGSDSLLLGAWQNLDDSLNTITFYANGEMADSYGGGAINEIGTYQLFRNSTNLDIGEVQDQQNMVLRQVFGTEEYYYEVVTLNEDLLGLIFTRDGSVVQYQRMPY